MSYAYTITITPPITESGNYNVSATDTTSTYTYTFSLPGTTTLYGGLNCGTNTQISGFFAALNYTDNTNSSTSYTINTGNYLNSSKSAFDPTSTCPAFITIINPNITNETYNIIETYSYGPCHSKNSSISFQLTGATAIYDFNTGKFTTNSNSIQNLNVTPSTNIPLSSTPNCSNFKTLTATPVNGTSYTTTYTFTFSTITILISIFNTYNNGWTPTSITINCSAGYTKNEISISIATLCALYYSASYYEKSNTTTCLNFISGIMLLAPIIQLFSLQ